ncbi:transaldolase [Heterostelium album PN500]|uniref:Transaldolase n=1 Tax=Heterostelium pallidum (strain ATCC 26659 / Pp 5 / PN500) TaxID=670386 RepID=D3BL83_HETP5|nr:transaldolase [Heterostelium album PN500]EFA77817.1 transaldolase [Heterostelium album PN500]|eukprot:XP_020429945.1 transaldolase [Heterostelium album PN500]
MSDALEKLREFTVIVADTADFAVLSKFNSQDSTTNPSLVYQAASKPQYKHLIDDAVAYAKKNASDKKARLTLAMDKLFVNFGLEILKIVPGRVSTEVDARLSYDTEGNIKKARELIKLYEDAGVKRDRVLIKLASTWEGIQAARVLEKEGIHCNMTLLFSLIQAAACAEANVTLISPFVGRITDYFKAKEGKDFGASADPGVVSVKSIYHYYKKHGYSTVVMGASFRTKEQAVELAGIDLLTLSPGILEALQASDSSIVSRKLSPSDKPEHVPEKIVPDSSMFAYELMRNEMAHFKTAEGIRKFADDLITLEKTIEPMLE